MSLDGLVLRALTQELQMLVGGRIAKIHQPNETDLVMQIRTQTRTVKLLLAVNPTYPRVHLTQAQYRNPLEAPMFCMLMRKYCEGAVLEAIRQVGMERILHLDLRHRDELGDVTSKRIVVELMGRHSNLILMDPATDAIHDGIRHVTPALSSYRVVLPGCKYVAPPAQDKVDPFEFGETDFVRLLAGSPNPGGPQTENAGVSESTGGDGEVGKHPERLSQRLVGLLSGIGPLSAREIVYRSGLPDDAEPLDADQARALWTALRAALQPIAAGRPTPNIVVPPSGKAVFSVLELTHVEGERTSYRSVSECLEAFYGDKAERDAVRQRAADPYRFVQNELQKNRAKLDKLNETLEEAKDADRFRLLGELLTASLHAVEKGADSFETVNYYDEAMPTIVIPLDPHLSPSENAQRYFRKYAKAKNSLTAVREQIGKTKEDIDYLETVLQQLEMASLDDLEEIREELIEQGYLRDRVRRGAKRKKPDKPALTSFVSSEGVPILVGKNNTQNDYLTMRLARPNDTWLHTKDIPGSHVVIRSERFGEQTLHEAAMLAAWFSRARESSRVPVDYTLVRHVRKPNGAKPGFVIYERQKTLYVTPDEALVKRLASGGSDTADEATDCGHGRGKT